jgi:peptidase M23-like protein
MKNLTFLLLLFFASPSLFAQRAIQLSAIQDAQGNVNFSCTNNAWCDYILEIDFTTLTNAKADHTLPFQAEVKPGLNKLFKLSKENVNDAIQFKYKINYFSGCLNPVVDTGFTYLLPITPGKEAQVYELLEIVKPAPGAPDPKNAYAIRLRMKPGDTLYAARRGRVVEVDTRDSLNDAGSTATGSWNYIEICHADCSFARYGILKKNGSFVKPGQFVEAGDPIGIVGGDRYGRGSDGRISVFYNLEEDDAPNNGKKIYLAFVPLKFWTKKNGKGMLKHGATYISEFPDAVITREMSKAELLKWKAKHKAKNSK